jgi:hypothetical protein
MLYIDYIWELTPEHLLFDAELNLDTLGWQQGDMFRLAEVDGRPQLVKVDPIEKFARGYD